MGRNLVWVTESDLLAMAPLESLSPDVRAACDAALERQRAQSMTSCSEAEAEILASVAKSVRETGTARFQWKQLSRCPHCDKDGGYVKFKSGRRRGENNTNRPLMYSGVEVNRETFACDDCLERVQAMVAVYLGDTEHACPEVVTGYAPKNDVYTNVKCKCGWTGHKGEMGLLPAVSGSYRGKCPSCGGENRFLGPSVIEVMDGFVLVQKGGV